MLSAKKIHTVDAMEVQLLIWEKCNLKKCSRKTQQNELYIELYTRWASCVL